MGERIEMLFPFLAAYIAGSFAIPPPLSQRHWMSWITYMFPSKRIWTFSGFPCLFSTLSGCFVLFSDIWQAHVASWIQTLPCSRLESFVTI